MSDLIYRTLADELEVRATRDGRTVHGRAVPYGVKTGPVFDPEYGKVYERFAYGAFAKSIEQRGKKVFLGSMHSRDVLPLGKATYFEERQDGLYADFYVEDTQAGNDALTLIRSGVVSSLSIGFKAIRNEYDKAANLVTRKEAALFEVSLVDMPAYEDAEILAVRTEEEYKGTSLSAVNAYLARYRQ